MKKENNAKAISPQVAQDVFMCPTTKTATAPTNTRIKRRLLSKNSSVQAHIFWLFLDNIS